MSTTEASAGAAGLFSADLRIGVVVKVEAFPQARRPAWKIGVDFGPDHGVLWTSAQATNYAEQDLLGRQVVGALNVGTKRIAGFVSQFLLLGAFDGVGSLSLLCPDREVEPGAKVL